ncbi:MAG TPA: lipase family protein [Candidatus Acidoferrales bacterium]|nr:lipase family protein [Candidatus Acidoferrales bacterium]
MSQPLDKQKAALYGQIVMAAYAMYAKPGADPLRPEPVGIPTGYELGAWIQMSDFVLNAEELKFYGIVVHETASPDSRIVAIRGTEGLVEWMDDAAAIPVPFRQAPSAGRVAWGFDKIYSTMKVVKRPLPKPAAVRARPRATAEPERFTGSFADQMEQLAISRERERGERAPLAEGRTRCARPTIAAGHSLGAALSTLFVMENDSKGKFDIATLCTFASPRVGNLEFVHTFNKLPIDSWRIVNTRDLIPRLPPKIPVVLDYDQVDTAYPFDSNAFAKNNLSCYHSLATYLHWLDNNTALTSSCVK